MVGLEIRDEAVAGRVGDHEVGAGARTAARWGVTPQAQKNGQHAAGDLAHGLAVDRALRSAPIAPGIAEVDRRAVVEGEARQVSWAAMTAWAEVIERIVTTRGPPGMPAGGDRWGCLVLRTHTSSPADTGPLEGAVKGEARADEERHAVRPPERPDVRHVLAAHAVTVDRVAREVRAEVGAGREARRLGVPGSVTSRSGQARGFLWQ